MSGKSGADPGPDARPVIIIYGDDGQNDCKNKNKADRISDDFHGFHHSTSIILPKNPNFSPRLPV
ncbi:MAG: hypothetical protein LBE92_08835 [Chryseobacterium sp.]|uniref:hypothetical protein n=1 Tax=Chryseobacterium sp. TaxID=1871047 RepID=UPI0028337B78|nr:hypothetical protein [Chryseobacterium sp.]MDR2236215.1 hypothetical protein [Chryseobacterium sp.]